jgi:hypothetical protein
MQNLMRLAAALAALVCLWAAPATSQPLPGGNAYPDPCQNPAVPKQSTPINITSATTTQLVAAVQGMSAF